MHNEKQPLFHLARRDEMPKSKVWMIRAASFLAALVIGAVLFAVLGKNPIEAYATIITGSLAKPSALRQTVKIAVPLLGTSLALAPCFGMRYWNIGAEGQITAGALAATYFALHFGKTWSHPVILIVMAAAACLFGGIWAAIPAFFKARYNTNETLFTLMMNYIIIGVVRWLQGGPWEGKPGSQIIPMFPDNAMLPKVFGVHCGWIIIILLTVFMYFYLTKMKQGYEIAVIGDSVNTARYAGMNVGHIVIRTVFLSGAICGLVGYLVTCGANGTLYDSVAAGVGFTAITVAWLAQLNPFAMIAISLLLAVLSKGAGTLQTRMEVPSSVSDILTGVILFSMLACEFFINYKIILRGHQNDGPRGFDPLPPKGSKPADSGCTEGKEG